MAPFFFKNNFFYMHSYRRTPLVGRMIVGSFKRWTFSAWGLFQVFFFSLNLFSSHKFTSKLSWKYEKYEFWVFSLNLSRILREATFSYILLKSWYDFHSNASKNDQFAQLCDYLRIYDFDFTQNCTSQQIVGLNVRGHRTTKGSILFKKTQGTFF